MHLVMGAGPVGTAIAHHLIASGQDVRLASRSGIGPDVAGAIRVSIDAADTAAVVDLAKGCDVIFNALNPSKYHQWPAQWPPMWAALIAAAERSGAVLATVSNLYSYGQVVSPMREDTPLKPVEEKGRIRADMWREAEQAHRDGRFAAVEVRASDYLGAGTQGIITRSLLAVVAGKKARIIGRPDVEHSWTYPGDVARLIVAAAADTTALGRVWHVPTNPARTQAEVLTEVAHMAGRSSPDISPTPPLVLGAIGLFDTEAKAAASMAYQFNHPFVIDDTAARKHFDLRPASWRDIIAETVVDLTGRPLHTAGGAR